MARETNGLPSFVPQAEATAAEERRKLRESEMKTKELAKNLAPALAALKMHPEVVEALQKKDMASEVLDSFLKVINSVRSEWRPADIEQFDKHNQGLLKANKQYILAIGAAIEADPAIKSAVATASEKMARQDVISDLEMQFEQQQHAAKKPADASMGHGVSAPLPLPAAGRTK